MSPVFWAEQLEGYRSAAMQMAVGRAKVGGSDIGTAERAVA